MSCAREKEKWGDPSTVHIIKDSSWYRLGQTPHLSTGLSKPHFTQLENGSSTFHPVLSGVEIIPAKADADLEHCKLSRNWTEEKGLERISDL